MNYKYYKTIIVPPLIGVESRNQDKMPMIFVDKEKLIRILNESEARKQKVKELQRRVVELRELMDNGEILERDSDSDSEIDISDDDSLNMEWEEKDAYIYGSYNILKEINDLKK